MVIVDSIRCCYCGGCVSVCPADALTLAETRLIVNEDCTDCEDCVFACPVGALHLEGRSVDARGETIKRRYDVVVVGAGPGGSTAAHDAAQAGLSVLLIEKRQEIGSPVRCAEGVGHEQLAQFIEPDPKWIAAEISQLEITTRANGATQTLRAGGGHGYILERRVFDRVLAERAARAGAEVRVKTAVTGVVMENGRARGVKIRDGAGQMEIEAQIVIAADGVEAQVGRWAGLDTQLSLNDTMACAQFLLAGIDLDPTCTSYTISDEFAPGGYVWVFPKGAGKANVGLGVQADLPRRANVIELLTRFIESQPNLARGYPVTLVV
ncbi:MAG: geranylgeranyl reductase family protein, partial [Anaerolineales bacterium]|nr:geranylgeranyl reductase family protein [Anaerolineales bacterium]